MSAFFSSRRRFFRLLAAALGAGAAWRWAGDVWAQFAALVFPSTQPKLVAAPTLWSGAVTGRSATVKAL